MEDAMKCIVHTDGGSRGNPGPAAVGVVIEEHKILTEFGKRIGETTNNVAEYTAVIEALLWLRDSPIIQSTGTPIIQFFLDSTLVVNQINGLFKVKDAKMRELLAKVRVLEGEIEGNISYTSIPREQNRRADMLVNRALDTS